MALLGVLLLGAAPSPAPMAAWGDPPSGPAAGFATILETDLRRDIEFLAGTPLEGRDSPSAGLSRAAEHIAARFAAAGLQGAGTGGSFLMPFSMKAAAPVPEECSLVLDEAATSFVYGEDFVPLWRANGSAAGPAVFYGYGIDSDSEKYDEIRGDTAGSIAVIVEGEPRHKRVFEGPEVSAAAALYGKLRVLEEAKVVGVLVVRRPPEEAPAAKKPAKGKPKPAAGADGGAGAGAEPTAEAAPARLAFRHTFASWVGGPPPTNPTALGIPALEITAEVAEQILGFDVLPLVAKSDSSGKAQKPVPTKRTVRLSAQSIETSVNLDNVVGKLPGRDQTLGEEYIVVGAHYDHIGVDERGRIGFGADDNASGTAALLEIAEALATAGPRRSILVCAFGAEEDGLLGSKAFADNLPVPRDKLVAMINMDMIGRGEAAEVAVLGLIENPALEQVLERALKLQPTKIKELVLRQGQDLFQRSDHYSFHQIGVPVLFFFEGLPIEKNADYHTWRDTIDKLDFDKITRTTRLVFNTTWLLAEDDERPPPPKRYGEK
ncbi:MAG: M20/M25/M40 family metallo-hydrolase [Planctomycetota bacterium]